MADGSNECAWIYKKIYLRRSDEGGRQIAGRSCVQCGPTSRTISTYGDSLATMALELPLLRITEATGFGGTCKCMREPAAMLLTGLGAFLVLLLRKIGS